MVSKKHFSNLIIIFSPINESIIRKINYPHYFFSSGTTSLMGYHQSFSRRSQRHTSQKMSTPVFGGEMFYTILDNMKTEPMSQALEYRVSLLKQTKHFNFFFNCLFFHLVTGIIFRQL